MISVWQTPQEEGRYIIGADVAEGMGGSESDRSVGLVLRRDTFEIVAKISGRWPPDMFGGFLEYMAKQYRYAYLVVESNKDGLATLLELQRLRYPHLYYRRGYDRPDFRAPKKPGWRTDVKTKPELVSLIGKTIRGKTLRIRDEQTVQELMTYCRLGSGETGCPEGFHDDHVMALGMCLVGHAELPMDLSADPVPKTLAQRCMAGTEQANRLRGEYGVEDQFGWRGNLESLF